MHIARYIYRHISYIVCSVACSRLLRAERKENSLRWFFLAHSRIGFSSPSRRLVPRFEFKFIFGSNLCCCCCYCSLLALLPLLLAAAATAVLRRHRLPPRGKSNWDQNDPEQCVCAPASVSVAVSMYLCICVSLRVAALCGACAV